MLSNIGRFALFLGFFLYATTSFGQRIKAGPMVGHVAMMEAKLWLQTTGAAKVEFVYWDTTGVGAKLANPRKYKKAATSQTYLADASNDHIVHATLGRLEPGTTYAYQIYINTKPASLPYPTLFKTPTLWQWRTDPPDFTVAMGSCVYIGDSIYDRPGKSYGSGYEIFQRIAEKKPDMMLWLGDNYYLREADWYSETGIRYRASHSRSVPEMQPLLAQAQHYAIWDDHDFGPNDSDRSYVLKERANAVFQDYWANPTYGIGDRGGITTMFQHEDMDFFLLDNRTFRTANNCKKCPNRQYFGLEQIEWLIEAMVASAAPFKIVASGGQILNSHKAFENYINLNETERAYLLKRIEEEQIKGVVFVTGDRHFTELSQMTTASGLRILDITASPLTSGMSTNPKDVNEYRVPGTLVDKEHNFCTLRFTGKRKERKMQVTVFGQNGQEMWTRSFDQ
jgi:alkaline phosphatase D